MFNQGGEVAPEAQPENPQAEVQVEGNAEEQAVAQSVQDVIGGLQDQIALLTQENAQLKDQALRIMADAQNAKRRQAEELQNFRKYANESVVEELLPVLDNFDRTLAFAQKGASVESLTDGVTKVKNQMQRVLEQYNVKRIEPLGQKFDPALHEAVTTEESLEHEDDTITEVLEAGYMISDRLIRPSRVKVAKNS